MSAALKAHVGFLPSKNTDALSGMPGMPDVNTLGWPIHLKALQCIERLKEKFEYQYTWVNEALVEAKRTFASPEIRMIPKTPSAKKCQQRTIQKVIEEEDEDEDFEQPKKKRNVKKATKPKQTSRGRKKDLGDSTAELCSMSSEDCSDQETTVSETTRPTRTTRARGRQNSKASSSRGTRTSRRNKQETADSAAVPEPIMSSRRVEQGEAESTLDLTAGDEKMETEDSVVVPCENTETVKRRSQRLSQSSVMDTEPEVSEMDTKTDGKGENCTPVVVSDSGDNMTPTVTRPYRKARRTLSMGSTGQKITHTPDTVQPNTPQHGSNKKKPFHMLNVKEKATKYEELVSRSGSSREASPLPTTPRAQRLCSNSPRQTPARSPRVQAIVEGSSPVHHQPAVSRATLVLAKQEATPTSSPVLTALKVKAAAADTSMSPRRSSRSDRRRSSCRVPGSKLSLSKRRSSIQRHKDRLSVEKAALSHLQEIKTRLANISITSAQHLNRPCPVIRSTRSKTRAAKPQTVGPRTPEAAKSMVVQNKAHLQEVPPEGTPPRRTTRSKMRLNKAPPPTLSDSDQGESTPTVNKQGYRAVPQAPKTGSSGSLRTKLHHLNQQEVASSPLTVKKPVSRSNSHKRLAGSRETSPSKKLCPDNSPEYDDIDSDGIPGTPSRCYTPPNHANSFLHNLKKKKLPTPGNLNCTVTSFLNRNTPSKKPSTKELVEQRRKQLLEKEKQEENRLQKRQEYLQKKAEDQRKKRENRQLLAAQRREEQLRKEKEVKKGLNQKLEEKKMLTAKMQEEKQKEEKEKQKIREKKMAEAELRRKQEEETRHQKMVEMKQEQERLKELQQRKKEYEEQERLKRIAEQRRLQEERAAEAEREKQKNAEKIRVQEEQRAREEQQVKKEKEEREKKEKAERDRLELEKAKEKQRQRQQELEKQRELERQRVLAEKKELEEKRLAQEEEKRLQKLIKSHNNALQQNTSLNQQNTSVSQAYHSKPAKLNTTVTMDNSSSKLDSTFTKEHKADTSTSEDNPDSYKITPVRKVYKPPTEENYNIQDLKSDDSTDDEDAPRKKIPSWATGPQLKAAIISQYYQPPDLDKIFDIIELPDLCKMFTKKKAKFFKRTSSAVWHTPIYMPSGKPLE